MAGGSWATVQQMGPTGSTKSNTGGSGISGTPLFELGKLLLGTNMKQKELDIQQQMADQDYAKMLTQADVSRNVAGIGAKAHMYAADMSGGINGYLAKEFAAGNLTAEEVQKISEAINPTILKTFLGAFNTNPAGFSDFMGNLFGLFTTPEKADKLKGVINEFSKVKNSDSTVAPAPATPPPVAPSSELSSGVGELVNNERAKQMTSQNTTEGPVAKEFRDLETNVKDSGASALDMLGKFLQTAKDSVGNPLADWGKKLLAPKEPVGSQSILPSSPSKAEYDDVTPDQINDLAKIVPLYEAGAGNVGGEAKLAGILRKLQGHPAVLFGGFAEEYMIKHPNATTGELKSYIESNLSEAVGKHPIWKNKVKDADLNKPAAYLIDKILLPREIPYFHIGRSIHRRPQLLGE